MIALQRTTRNALPGEGEPPAERQAFVDSLENVIRRSIATAMPAALVLVRTMACWSSGMLCTTWRRTLSWMVARAIAQSTGPSVMTC